MASDPYYNNMVNNSMRNRMSMASTVSRASGYDMVGPGDSPPSRNPSMTAHLDKKTAKILVHLISHLTCFSR